MWIVEKDYFLTCSRCGWRHYTGDKASWMRRKLKHNDGGYEKSLAGIKKRPHYCPCCGKDNYKV